MGAQSMTTERPVYWPSIGLTNFTDRPLGAYQMKRNFIKAIFVTLLLTGSLGFYLWFYGAFRISLGGWLIAISLTLIIVFFDLKWRACTHNKAGKLSIPNLMICLIFYYALAGNLILRTWHETFGNSDIHVGTASHFESRSRGGRLCRYKVTIGEPAEFSGRKICTSRKAYIESLRHPYADRFTWSRRIAFKVKTSPFGNTISLLTDQ